MSPTWINPLKEVAINDLANPGSAHAKALNGIDRDKSGGLSLAELAAKQSPTYNSSTDVLALMIQPLLFFLEPAPKGDLLRLLLPVLWTVPIPLRPGTLARGARQTTRLTLQLVRSKVQ